MSNISTEQLTKIAVSTVQDFLNDQVPLSTGLAKYASEYQLNSDQIHRAVEATNSIAHLKVLSMVDDRTVEFPLCKYAEVMAGIVGDVGSVGVTGSGGNVEEMSKVAEKAYTPLAYEDTLTENAKLGLLFKQASVLLRKKESMEMDRDVMYVSLIKAAAALRKDTEVLEKIAEVAPELSSQLTMLIFGVQKEVKNTGLFKSAELIEVTKFAELYKQARDLARDLAVVRKDSDELQEKRASITKAVGSDFSSKMSDAAGKIKTIVKGAPGQVNRGMNSVIDPAVHGAGKMVGQAGSTVAKAGINTANAISRTAQNIATGTKSTGVTVGKVAGRAGTEMLVGGAIAQSMNPRVNPNTGASTKVWDSIHFND